VLTTAGYLHFFALDASEQPSGKESVSLHIGMATVRAHSDGVTLQLSCYTHQGKKVRMDLESHITSPHSMDLEGRLAVRGADTRKTRVGERVLLRLAPIQKNFAAPIQRESCAASDVSLAVPTSAP
jgi:hypothetical protein